MRRGISLALLRVNISLAALAMLCACSPAPSSVYTEMSSASPEATAKNFSEAVTNAQVTQLVPGKAISAALTQEDPILALPTPAGSYEWVSENGKMKMLTVVGDSTWSAESRRPAEEAGIAMVAELPDTFLTYFDIYELPAMEIGHDYQIFVSCDTSFRVSSGNRTAIDPLVYILTDDGTVLDRRSVRERHQDAGPEVALGRRVGADYRGPDRFVVVCAYNLKPGSVMGSREYYNRELGIQTSYLESSPTGKYTVKLVFP